MEIVRQTAVASYVVVPLIDAAARPSYKASPTLAAGDVKVIRHTGAAWNIANIGTLPAIVDAGVTKQILVTLTATELTSDNLDYPIIVQFIDQTATKEWDDQEIIIWTKAVPANATQILGIAISTPATAGILDVNLKNIANAAVSTSTAQLGVNAVQAGATAWGSGAITAASIASSAITSAKFAADAINAAAIADNAIDIATFAADVKTGSYLNAQIKGQDNIDFGALQKASLNAATPASVVGAVGSIAANGITTLSLATDAINAASVKADAVTKIQTGLATPTNITAGTITTVTNLTNAPTNGDLTATMKTSVNTEVDTAITDVKLDHLIAVAESGDVVNSSIIAKLASKSVTPAFSSYNNTTDSLEAIADNESPAEVTANVTKIDGVALATHASGVMPADLLDIDNTALASATFNLKKLNVVNGSGDAIVASSTGSNGNGINASGNGSGAGLKAAGGATGSGINAVGGATSGDGISALAPRSGDGIRGGASDTGAGMHLTGGLVDGDGLLAVGGAGGGGGMVLGGGAGNGNGLQLAGDGSGAGLYAEGGATGDGIHATAGTTSGEGISAIGKGTGSGILANSGTSNGSNNAGIHAVGNAPNSHGMSLVSGANGNDLNLETPSTNLEAVVDQEAVRNAMSLAPTGDDPVSGSIDDKLDDIKSQTDKMNFTGDNIDANTEAIDTNAGAAAKLAASADTETLCTVDTSRPFAPTTTEFETGSTVLAKDRWVIFRSGTLIGQAKPITACELISGKSHITTDAFTAAPSNGDTFVIV